MGKRKLKFDARKNYDRKIRKCSLMVCEVLDVEKLEQVPASAGLMTVPEEQLIVTAPIASFVSSPAPDLPVLHKRLLESKRLPAAWACSVTSTCLVICKMSVTVPMAPADAMYTVTISLDFTWIGQNEVAIDENDLLCYSVPRSLCSVESVARVVSVLDGSKFCIGNADDKFSNLVKRRKGNLWTSLVRNCHTS